MSRNPTKININNKLLDPSDLKINIDETILGNQNSEDKEFREYFTQYFDDGITIKSIFYNTKDNPRDGLLKQYHKNGQLQFEANLIDLKYQDNNMISYYKNGNIHCNVYYKDGVLHGLSKGYYFGGKLAMEVLWDDGKAISGVYYNKNGYKNTMTQKQIDKKTQVNI